MLLCGCVKLFVHSFVVFLVNMWRMSYICHKIVSKRKNMKKVLIGLAAVFAGVHLFSCTQAQKSENPEREYVIVVHGGAGAMKGLENDAEKSAQYYAALDSALTIGDAILARGGEGPEAVIAVINYFEGNPLFNAGVGATYH